MGKSVPVINQWYQDIAVNRLFEVVAVDEYSALIDIRYADIPCDDEDYKGNSDDNSGLDEISFEEWSQMTVMPASAPEDWRSSLGFDQNSVMLADDLVLFNPESGSIDNIKSEDYLFGWDEF